jgi:hypothetical protein
VKKCGTLKQYLDTNNFSVNNRHFVIISSQATQLYITKVPYKQLNCHDYIKNHFSSEISIKLTLSDSVQSHDSNKMQHETSDILFSLFKITFNLKGSLDQEFSFIVKILKTSFFVRHFDKIHIY